MDVHEAANIFPIYDENIADLADDIEANGQQVPIELIGGKIVDGRRRFEACRRARVEPLTVEVSPADPIAYVLSLNLHRRHLTPSQRSVCAARARGIYEREAKERQKGGQGGRLLQENLPEAKSGQARDAAGKAFGVSGKSVDYATRVIEKGIPELVNAVDEGRMAVSTAAILAAEPEEVQRVEVENPKRNRKYRPGAGGGNSSPEKKKESKKDEPAPGVYRGVGLEKAHEAIACLKRIPMDDGLRDSAFHVVADWIKHNK